MARAGEKVGLLDADIHGPSVPTLMGIHEKPLMEGDQFLPFEREGVKAMSIGFLVDPRSALVWRGLMVQKAIRQLFSDVKWGDLDILIVDMPPGTGDIPLTINQWVPLSGGMIVATSDPLAMADAVKGAEMLKKMHVPLLGFIENMSHIDCPHCGGGVPLVEESLVSKEAKTQGVPLLGSIPFDKKLRMKGASSEIIEKIFDGIIKGL